MWSELSPEKRPSPSTDEMPLLRNISAALSSDVVDVTSLPRAGGIAAEARLAHDETHP